MTKFFTTILTIAVMVMTIDTVKASSGDWVRGEDGKLHWQRDNDFSLNPATDDSRRDSIMSDMSDHSMSDYFRLGYFRGSNRMNGMFIEGREPLVLGLHLSGTGLFTSEPKTPSGASDRDLRHFSGALNLESWLPSRLTGGFGNFGLVLGYADGDGADDAIFRPGVQLMTELWQDAEICVQLFPVSFGQAKDEETRSLGLMFWQKFDCGKYSHFEIWSNWMYAYQPANLVNPSSHDSLEGQLNLGWELPVLSNVFLHAGTMYSNNTPGNMRDKRVGYNVGALYQIGF